MSNAAKRQVVLILLPLPHTAPVPEVAAGQRVVGRHLHIGSGTVVNLLDGEGKAVDKDTSLAVRRHDAVARNLLVFLVALHVLEANPARTPSGRKQMKAKSVRHAARRRVELEAQRVLLRFLVVYPKGYTVLVFKVEGLLPCNVDNAARREVPLQALGAFLVEGGR